MNKTPVVFLLAILLPSLLLGGLALRTAGQQQLIIERQTAALYQAYTDDLAQRSRALVAEHQRQFVDALGRLLAREAPQALAAHFSPSLAAVWPIATTGFAVTLQGEVLSPTGEQARLRGEWQSFLAQNQAFLSNQMPAEIFQVPAVSAASLPVGKGAATKSSSSVVSKDAPRKVMPQREGYQKLQEDAPGQNVSQLVQRSANFRDVVSPSPSGTIARFSQNELEILLWHRPPQAPGLVFGAVLSPRRLQTLRSLLDGAPPITDPDGCLAILNERAEPVALSSADCRPDWKQPFVATEIGELLPHWEAALYLTRPEQLKQTARLATLTLALLILSALAAISAGAWLIIADSRRRLALAQQKTDFVSNVSHELKSPLTSIRMFAELLQQGRAVDEDKRGQYLRIIALESERLTRLINNVLDFARLERGRKPLEKRLVDLYPAIEHSWNACEAHLRSLGFSTVWNADPPPNQLVRDPDALAQALVNLLSNAEKYSPDRKEIELQTVLADGSLEMRVLDRGLGVAAGQEQRIFEPFHRAHDSLASGIPGTGLGLTLARQLVREHGGEILCQRREGGGSVFTIRIPLKSSP